MKLIPDFVKNQPVRIFALICVAVTSTYIMVTDNRLINTMTSPGWCNRTLRADQIAQGSDFDALKACVGIITIQLHAIATDWHIRTGVIALCLLTLMVIVVAGGHLSFTAPGGTSANIGGGPVGKAADEVANAAVEKAAEVKTDAKLAPAPDPNYNGPAMPEPPKE